MSSNKVEDKIETSLKITIAIVLTFFIVSMTIVLISPRFIDESWMSPSSRYQVQMYERLDPVLYISNSASGNYELQHVQHVMNGKTLFAFVETDRIKILADGELSKYVTAKDDPKIKLTSRLLLLKKSDKENSANEVFQLYDPKKDEAFINSPIEGSIDNWAAPEEFTLLDPTQDDWQNETGHLFVKNPFEYRIKEMMTPTGKGFIYDPNGRPIKDLQELTGVQFKFRSRKELIAEGEHIFAIEGCWYCHTDQTRTLVQDTVLNGSDSYPAPPSSANEYIYQNVTFPGTRRIGPDLSRVGVKRPSRDWHKSHFWAPKTQSPGSIMPTFHHFFDEDPRGTPGSVMGVPNFQFEAIYQYLMTKGTRITPPNEAWWLGKDPVKTKELIEDIPKQLQESVFLEADASRLKQRSDVEAAHARGMGDADGFKGEDVGDGENRFLKLFRYKDGR